MPRIIGIYDLPGKTAAAITQIRARGYQEIITYAPAPFEEVEDAVDPKPSGVRLYTLIGGLAGVVTGFAQLFVSRSADLAGAIRAATERSGVLAPCRRRRSRGASTGRRAGARNRICRTKRARLRASSGVAGRLVLAR